MPSVICSLPLTSVLCPLYSVLRPLTRCYTFAILTARGLRNDSNIESEHGLGEGRFLFRPDLTMGLASRRLDTAGAPGAAR